MVFQTSLVVDEDRVVDTSEGGRTQLDALWQQIANHLLDQKTRVVQEISSYPSPIPACDAQFNGLLEDRATIMQDLDRVYGILRQQLPTDVQISRLHEFLASSQHLGSDLTTSIRAAVSNLQSRDAAGK